MQLLRHRLLVGATRLILVNLELVLPVQRCNQRGASRAIDQYGWPALYVSYEKLFNPSNARIEVISGCWLRSQPALL
jgi:hypothetical protein